MRLPNSIIYFSVDALLPLRGNPIAGFDDFSAEMESAGLPVVWVSARNRFQLEAPRRAVGHTHPFIAEGGSGVYIPEGYFNTRAEKVVRLGRFLCARVADQQPAAAEALEELSEATGVATVPLPDLSPRELAQNSGLPQREAELLRHRDFDQLFFFAGAGEEEVARFAESARQKRVALRRTDAFWSLACGASIQRCVRQTDQLYQRALRTRLGTIAVAPEGDELLAACNRRLAIAVESAKASKAEVAAPPLRLHDSGFWERVAEFVLRRNR